MSGSALDKLLTNLFAWSESFLEVPGTGLPFDGVLMTTAVRLLRILSTRTTPAQYVKVVEKDSQTRLQDEDKGFRQEIHAPQKPLRKFECDICKARCLTKAITWKAT